MSIIPCYLYYRGGRQAYTYIYMHAHCMECAPGEGLQPAVIAANGIGLPDSTPNLFFVNLHIYQFLKLKAPIIILL